LHTCNYSVIANSQTSQFVAACAKSSQSVVSSPLSPSNGFQYSSFFSFRVHVLTGRRLSHNSLIAPTDLTPTPAAILHQPPTLLTDVSRLSRNVSCFSLYGLGMDLIEDTSPNSSSIVASRSYRNDCSSQLLHCCILEICCIATEPLRSNDRCIVTYLAVAA
jgi:hypothetical protein